MSCFYCLVKCLQSHSDFLSFLLSLAAKVDVLDLHGARVLQMKIYEVHRGREMGGARGERGVAKRRCWGEEESNHLLVWAYSVRHWDIILSSPLCNLATQSAKPVHSLHVLHHFGCVWQIQSLVKLQSKWYNTSMSTWGHVGNPHAHS